MKNMLIVLALCGGVLALHSFGFAAAPLAWKYQYDEDDRLVRKTDPAGCSTMFQYSGGDKGAPLSVTKTSPEGPATVWQLDDRSRLAKMSDEFGAVDYGYDELGRLNRVQRKGAPAITYEYDTLDRVTRLQIGDFYELVYKYDFLGRLESAKTPAGIIWYEYRTGQGIFIRNLPNGVETQKHYDVSGLLHQIVHVGPDHKLLAEFTYHYRPDGLIDSIRARSSRGDFVTQYMYDSMGRLVQATSPGDKTYRYEYDEIGNRIKAARPGKALQECVYDWAGRLLSIDRKPAQHDAAGNLTSLPFGDTARQLSFTPDGQIKAVDGGKVTYGYDGNGYLVRRIAGGVETHFIPDPVSPIWQPLVMEEKGGKRTLIVWEGALPLIVVRDGRPEYLLHDHLGSVRLTTDNQGTLSKRTDYSPFGNPEDRMAGAFRPGFAGLIWDEHAAAHLTLRRAYDPLLGRFLQPDPIHDVSATALLSSANYTYCWGNPVYFVDRDGNAPQPFERPWGAPGLLLPSSLPNTGRGAPNPFGSGGPKIYPGFGGLWGAPGFPGTPSAPFGGLGGPNPFGSGGLKIYPPMTNPAPSFVSDLGKLNIDLLISGLLEAYKSLPGPWGSYGAMFKTGYDSLSAAIDLLETIKFNKVHSGDPAFDWKVATLFLKTYGAVGSHTFLGGFAGGAAYLAELANIAGNAIRSRTMQSRAERLVTFGGAILPGHAHFGESYSDHAGSFSIYSDRYSAVGGWNLSHNRRGWFVRDTHSRSWARSSVRNLQTMDGSKITGSFSAQETRTETGKSPFNLYGPTSETVTRTRHEKYTISKKGAGVIPLDSAGQKPSQPSPKIKPTLSPRNDMGKGGGQPPPSGGGGGGGGGLAASSSPRPSPVGGVYLGGAGQTLDGLGLVSGISLDRNNNLVLIGQEGKTLQLPSLRLDDVVTIFRSVYLHGEGPSVTIDPASEKPEESAMIIRHGKATEDTYVGWVLYEADRLMKGYNLGTDNKTTQDIKSGVAGYLDVLNTIYFGGGSLQKGQPGSHWERYWIVPAEVRRFEGARRELTLLDVPLKVKTQSMQWQNGQLVDDPAGRSSPGALAFTDWFTRQYDLIAGERFLTPPFESGMTHPVPVFSELRRIALITAIAEKLRDQGVSMPFWMLDYEVKPVPFEKTTPALTVARSNGKMQAQMFGGVQLSPETKEVKVFTRGSDLKALPGKEEREAVQQRVELAAGLEGPVQAAAVKIAPLKLEKLIHQGREYQLVSLPGADTQALGPFQMEAADLSVPLPDGRALNLTRSHNSFFDPQGPWGRGWALDLPRLIELSLPVERKGSAVQSRSIYELTTPLNTAHARFSKTAKVPALNHSKLLVPDQAGAFLGLGNDKPDFLSVPTLVLFLNNGSRWHFSESGHLIAVVDAGLISVYERDRAGSVSRIVGLLGRKVVGEIGFQYGPEGRLQSAEGKNAHARLVVNYEYDSAGRLKAVKTNEGRVGYRYQGHWIAAITWQDAGAAQKEETVRSLEYNSRGQLVRESFGMDAPMVYTYAASPEGVSATVKSTADKTETQVLRFDSALRPTQARYADGTNVVWRYPEKGGQEMEVKAPNQPPVKLTQSPDQRRVAAKSSEWPEILAEKDEAGRLVSISENGQPLLRQYWSGVGQIERVENQSAAVWPQLDPDGLVSSLILAPPEEKGQFRRFQEIKLDFAGQPVEIRDHRGLQQMVQYDETGEIAAWIEKRDGKNFGVNLTRDKEGRILKVDSSWGTEQRDYDKKGNLSWVLVERQGQRAAVELESGLVRKLRHFDGAETRVSYYGDGAQAGLPKEVAGPNGVALKYSYDDAARLARVDVDARSQVVLDYDADGRLTGYAWRPTDSAR